MDIFCKDKILNISNYYFKPGFAYGGSCLPKDLLGLQTIGKSLKLDLPVLNSISYSNDLQIDRAFNIIKNFKESDILILGVTFKKDTDDLRNSPSVSLINLLNNTQSKNIRVYDPNLEYLDSTLIKNYFNPELIINDLRDGLNKSK